MSGIGLVLDLLIYLSANAKLGESVTTLVESGRASPPPPILESLKYHF